MPVLLRRKFKSIKNMVITEALKIGSHLFTFEDEIAPEPVPSYEITPSDHEPMLDDADFYEPQEITDVTFHVGWSDQYKIARQYLYGSDTIEQNFEEAYKLFLLEAEIGNALAMHDLGRMFADGLGRDIDSDAAYEWYKKALNAFLSAEAEKPKSYIQYRIGKMFAAGLGTEQNYEQAASWFSQAVENNHKHAEYSLGDLYYGGQGVMQSYEAALGLYVRSAKQGIPYAYYELAKMYRDGIGTQKNIKEADRYFKSAFIGFSSLEEESHDDKLQYRLGQMSYTGTGTKKDIPAAISYFEKSAKLGNANAQYLLGKLWLETGTDDPLKAVAWIEKAAKLGVMLVMTTNSSNINLLYDWRFYDVGICTTMPKEGSHAIDLVKRLYNLSFLEAVSLLLGGEQGVEYKQYSKNSEQEQKKSFKLPEANTDMRRVFAYLIKQRFIDRNYADRFELEQEILQRGCAYEDDFDEVSKPPINATTGGTLHNPVREHQGMMQKPPLRTD